LVIAGIQRKFFTVKYFTIEFFSVQSGCYFTNFSWTRSRYTLKWKSVKETIVYMLPSLPGMRLLAQCKREQITKVIVDSYAVAVKKKGIIFGHLLRKISWACRITFAILTSRNGLTPSIEFFPLTHRILLVLHDLPKL